jgi:uncharacterized membrane protein
MIIALVIAFVAFAAVSYFLADSQVKRVCYFGMVVCVVGFAVILVLHLTVQPIGTWPLSAR